MKICFLSGLKDIIGQDAIELEFSGPVSSLLDALGQRYGDGLRDRIFEPGSGGKRNSFVKILVDGEDIRQGDPLLTGQETLFIFLPIAGG